MLDAKRKGLFLVLAHLLQQTEQNLMHVYRSLFDVGETPRGLAPVPVNIRSGTFPYLLK